MNRVVAISREFGSLFGGRDYNGHSLQDDLWGIQKQLIEEIAEKRSISFTPTLNGAMYGIVR